MERDTRHARGTAVLAMERMVCCINNEEIWDSWFMYGVADGDIGPDTNPMDEILDSYCEDSTFKDLLTLFNRLMHRAWLDGGLYCQGICGMDRQEYLESLGKN